MYLETLRLNHFRCFSEQHLRLGKLTLLLGANSAGKSSLLHGILAALQSDQFPLDLSLNGSLVTLGDFRAVSFQHHPTHDISLSMNFSGHHLGPITLQGTYRRSSKTGMPELSRATLTDPAFSLSVRRSDSQYRADWAYSAPKDTFRKQLEQSTELRQFFEAVDAFLRDARRQTRRQKRTQPSTSEPPAPNLLASPPPSGHFSASNLTDLLTAKATPHYFPLGPHLTALPRLLQDFRREFNYVGAFRLEPQRSYFQTSRRDLRVERNGQNCVEQVARWGEERAPQLRLLKTALRQLKLLSALRTPRVRSGMFEVHVRPTLRSAPVSLADVGFGVGQVLPILVADLQLPKGGTLALSQPEIHLHPSVQAELATYLAKRTASTTNRYILETHSEYFINRVRLLVANETLKPDDVSAVYLSNDGVRAAAHEIRFTPSGKIEGAPKDFFDTYMLDVMNIAMAATS